MKHFVTSLSVLTIILLGTTSLSSQNISSPFLGQELYTHVDRNDLNQKGGSKVETRSSETTARIGRIFV